jgi:hypothetical protein
MWKEQRLPSNVDPFESQLENPGERTRLVRIFERGLDRPAGYVFPVSRDAAGVRWQTGPWFLRQERCYLVPGDSPIGYRLPLDSLPWAVPSDITHVNPPDPTQTFPPLAPHAEIRQQLRESDAPPALAIGAALAASAGGRTGAIAAADGLTAAQLAASDIAGTRGTADPTGLGASAATAGTVPGAGPSPTGVNADAAADGAPGAGPDAAARRGAVDPTRAPHLRESAGWVTRTAMCAEARNGV